MAGKPLAADDLCPQDDTNLRHRQIKRAKARRLAFKRAMQAAAKRLDNGEPLEDATAAALRVITPALHDEFEREVASIAIRVAVEHSAIVRRQRRKGGGA